MFQNSVQVNERIRNLKSKVLDPEAAQMTRSLKGVLLNPCRISSRVSARSAVVLERHRSTSKPERKRRSEGEKEGVGHVL